MKITLLRHAEVEERYIGCYNGHIDIGLSPKGYSDAKKLKQVLNRSDFDAIFCSDLIRAKETLKQFIDSDDAVYTPSLREKSWGEHEGLNFDEIIAKDEIKYINFQQWIDDLGGETMSEFISRVEEFFFSYLPSLKKENILIVTHSGVIKTFISIVENIPLEKAFKRSLPYMSLSKLSL
ncbi:MAG: histidine phosphatase family protein [Campylobacterota bacterium]|nr:histidine phosphatase family protein [Campylobacterota bacterium]